MSLLPIRPQDAPRTLLQYQELACFNENCVVVETKENPLKGCSRCKRVKYCSVACRNNDFKVHKAFCKAFSALRTALPSTYPLEQLLSDNDDDVPPIGAYERDVLMSQLAAEMQDLIQRIGRFDMGKIPNYLLYLEPRCLWCYRTKAHISATQLLSCPDCLGATYCCTDHRNKGRVAHTTVISDNGLTQCKTFQICNQDDDFMRTWSALPDKPGDVMQWAPDRILSPSSSLPELPDSWDAYFTSTSCPYPSGSALMRTMVTIALSMPLTILEALQRFSVTPTSIGSKMVVHVLGAQVDFEIKYGAMAFEEIMHQLPWVKELVVEFIGPCAGSMRAGDIPMDTCSKCRAAGRSRIYRMSNLFYHDFAKRTSYMTPAISVAFNSGLHETPNDWRPSIKVLVEKNVPCVFTSYNGGEARDDARHLHGMGAKIVWAGERNRWSGQKAHFDYFTEDLFWHENAFTLGFRGSA